MNQSSNLSGQKVSHSLELYLAPADNLDRHLGLVVDD
jgi:hypothetical protein